MSQECCILRTLRSLARALTAARSSSFRLPELGCSSCPIAAAWATEAALFVAIRLQARFGALSRGLLGGHAGLAQVDQNWAMASTR
jgi:hypothetical protein